MSSRLFEVIAGPDVSDDMLQDAARLFNANYGVWGSGGPRPGARVKMSPARLKQQILPSSSIETCVYVRVTVDGTPAGHLFACRWRHADKRVCWVTQMVVDARYRRRGLASGLLATLRQDTDDVYGIMSSHPAACLAAASAFGDGIEKMSLDFIKHNARTIMEQSPVQYINGTQPCGNMFEESDERGLVSGADTRFFVDHTEPLEALREIRRVYAWPLGELPAGHEFLVVLPALERRRRLIVHC